MGLKSKADNRRRHGRINMSLKVSLVISGGNEIYAVTRDISEQGVFLLLDRPQMPDIGEELNVQVQGLPGEQAPWVRMQVVRIESEGVGLRLVEGD